MSDSKARPRKELCLNGVKEEKCTNCSSSKLSKVLDPKIETWLCDCHYIKLENVESFEASQVNLEPEIKSEIIIKEEHETANESVAEVYIEHFNEADIQIQSTDTIKVQPPESYIKTHEESDVKVESVDNITPAGVPLDNVSSSYGHDILYTSTSTIPKRVKFQKKTNEKKTTKCFYCQALSTNTKTLVRHLSQNHKDRKTCQVCGSDFPTVKVLFEHVSKTHNVKDILCQRCPSKTLKRFKTIFDLLLHLNMTHERNSHSNVKKVTESSSSATNEINVKMPRFICEVCTKNRIRTGFQSLHVLEDHYMTIHNLDTTVISLLQPKMESLFCCQSCPAVFKHYRRLEIHIERGSHKVFRNKICKYTRYDYPGDDYTAHLQANHYSCKKCHCAPFCNSSEQYDHILNVHPVKCTICDKTFHYAHYLQRHTKKHHTTRCKMNKTDFKTEDEFSQHRKERHFMCKFFGCLESFCSKSQWTKHHAEKHYLKSKVMRCFACCKTYLSTSSLYSHVASCHRGKLGRFQCRFCKSLYKSIYNLKRHNKTCRGTSKKLQNKFPCKLCDETNFGSLSSMKRHKRRVHQKTKLLKCQFCDQTFIYMSYLKNHVRRCVAKFCDNCKSLFSSYLMLLIHQRNCGIPVTSVNDE